MTEKIRSVYGRTRQRPTLVRRGSPGWDLIEDEKKVMRVVFSEDRDGFERQTIFQARPAHAAEPDRGRPPSPAKAAAA